MNLEAFLRQALELTGTLDPRTAALLFIICAIGEFGLSIPYLLESAWLLMGYQFGRDILPFPGLLGLWLAAQAGRQAGAITLYHVTRLGAIPLARVFHKRPNPQAPTKISPSSKIINRISSLSPFSVALGRLFWLRFPMTLALALRKNLKTLSLGVLLSSLVWDTVYIAVGGIVGATAVLKPSQMFVASLAGLTLIYLATIIVRHFIRRRQPT